jgi:hypothetical protein
MGVLCAPYERVLFTDTLKFDLDKMFIGCDVEWSNGEFTVQVETTVLNTMIEVAVGNKNSGSEKLQIKNIVEVWFSMHEMLLKAYCS